MAPAVHALSDCQWLGAWSTAAGLVKLLTFLDALGCEGPPSWIPGRFYKRGRGCGQDRGRACVWAFRNRGLARAAGGGRSKF